MKEIHLYERRKISGFQLSVWLPNPNGQSWHVQSNKRTNHISKGIHNEGKRKQDNQFSFAKLLIGGENGEGF